MWFSNHYGPPFTFAAKERHDAGPDATADVVEDIGNRIGSPYYRGPNGSALENQIHATMILVRSTS